MVPVQAALSSTNLSVSVSAGPEDGKKIEIGIGTESTDTIEAQLPVKEGRFEPFSRRSLPSDLIGGPLA